MKKAKTLWPVKGHKKQVNILQRSIEQNNIASAYLLYGPRGLGKKYLVNIIMRVLRNQSLTDSHSLEYSDTFRLPQNDERQITVNDMRNALRFLNLRQVDGAKKFLVIERVEAMTLEAANALLKKLEEPAVDTHIFLIAEKIDRVPITIRSRCQLLKLNPLTKTEMEEWLDSLSLNQVVRETIIKLALGRPGRAKILSQDNLENYRERLQHLVTMLNQSVNDNFTTFNAWLESKKSEAETYKSADLAEESLIELEYLELLLRDILMIRIGQSDIFNILFKDSIMILADRLPLAEIGKLIKALNNLRQQLELASNVQLVWENFLLQIPIKKIYEK